MTWYGEHLLPGPNPRTEFPGQNSAPGRKPRQLLLFSRPRLHRIIHPSARMSHQLVHPPVSACLLIRQPSCLLVDPLIPSTAFIIPLICPSACVNFLLIHVSEYLLTSPLASPVDPSGIPPPPSLPHPTPLPPSTGIHTTINC